MLSESVFVLHFKRITRAVMTFFFKNSPVKFSWAGPPHHLCMGCCADRADTVRKGAELLQCLFKAMSIPALNKWTKIFPAAGHCVLLSQLWGLGPAAFKAQFAEPSGQVSSSSEEGVVAEDANLAVYPSMK